MTLAVFEETYQDAWKCNFLGLPAEAEVPAHVDKQTYALLGTLAHTLLKEKRGGGGGGGA